MAYDSPRGDDPLEQFSRFVRSFKFAWVIGLVVVAAVVVAGVTSYYTVEPDEEVVVLRLGKYSQTAGPGLHLKIPFGIDRAIKLPVERVLQEEFGFRTLDTRGARTAYSEKGFEEESLMLTGDLNVADVEWVVQFQIADPRKFLFHSRDPIRNIRDTSQAVMRRVVGDRLVSDVLTVGRVEIASAAHQLTQDVLDRYDMGVRIVAIKLQDANPPEPVKPSFNDVNAAKQEQEQMINQAERAYNEVIPRARGQAEEEVSKAEGYAAAVLNRARGDAEKFRLLLGEYRNAPTITRRRLYLEAVEKLYERFGRITIVDSEIKGILPVFDAAGARIKAEAPAKEGR